MNAHAVISHQNIEAEQALLGSIMTDERALDEALTALEVEDLFDPLHQRILQAAIALKNDGMRVSALTIKARMGNDAGLAEVGGSAYLNSLSMAAPVLANIADMSRIIADSALRRRLDEQMEAARVKLGKPGTPVMECISGVLDASSDAAERTARRRATITAGEAGYALLKSFDSGAAPQVTIPTGLTNLDEMIGGFRPGELIVVAGRPGMGKSTLASNIARAAAMSGRPAEYHSLEMTAPQLSARLMTDIDFEHRGQGEWGLSYKRLYHTKAGQREQDRAMKAAGILHTLPITIHDPETRPTIAEIDALARARAARLGGLGIIILDHIGLVAPSDRYRGNRVQEIAEITGRSKALARATRWAVVILSQLNRAVEGREDKKPTLSDLRDSGSIEQDADVVIGMYRHAYYLEQKKPEIHESGYDTWDCKFREAKNRLDLIVLKNRMGETGAVQCFCDMGASVIRDSGGA